MKFCILTIFPEMFDSVINQSMLARAVSNNHINFDLINIRDFSQNKHKNTDDYTYGGGAGMLMIPQPIDDAFIYTNNLGYTGKRIYLSPRGKQLNQELVEQLAKENDLRLLCGHYEGVDERVIQKHIDMEISIGDYILTGGELAAMVVIDAVSRYVDGVLGSDESIKDESFSQGLLEYPQYTRPADYKEMLVPDVLLSGNHAKINEWRREQSLKCTYENRPDLLEKLDLTKKDKLFLKKLREE